MLILIYFFFYFFIYNIILLDAAPKSPWYMQEEATIAMIGIRDLHDTVFFYLILILVFVSYIIIINILQKNLLVRPRDLTHNTNLEIIWTILPAIILILLAIPTFKLLYNIEEVLKPLITLKVEGNQWFWNYSIVDTLGINVEFSSYPKNNIEKGELRLLEVDNRIFLPILTPIRVLVTASDVLHSWAIPSLGVKIDAIPGRINHTFLYLLREGVYYGQCSELCGLAHFNMPIVIEGVKSIDYISWLFSFTDLKLSEFIKIIKRFENFLF